MEINKENISEENNKHINKTQKCIETKLKLLIIILIYLLIKFIINKHTLNINKIEHIKQRQRMHELKTKEFAIVHRLECPQCGFFFFLYSSFGMYVQVCKYGIYSYY